LIIACTIAVVSTFLQAPMAGAMGSRDGDDRSITEDGFSIEVFRPGSGSSSGGESCSWRQHQYFGSVTNPEIQRVDSNGFAYRLDPQSGEELILYSVGGGSNCTNRLVWVPTSLTPRSLIPGLRDKIERALPTPTPDMSPPPELGTYMNLGIWLAVTDPGAITERAAAGPVWAEGRGTLTGFEVDFGNGATVYCDAIGVPLRDVAPALATFEHGPCGYTYGWPDKRGEYDVTITSMYHVTYRLSNGETGVLGNVDRTTAFPYEVAELVTVGTNN
jgi:hypothetical protein